MYENSKQGSQTMESSEREREGAEWREVPPLVCAGALQAAVQRELEGRGLSASSVSQPPAGKPSPPSHTPTTPSGACFGVDLDSPQPRLMLDPTDGHGQGVWLPRVFVECVRELRENLHSPGIFRKAGSVTRQRTIRISLEAGQSLTTPNVHDVASILKQYLRELPSPLVPPSLSPLLEEVWSCGRERVEMVMCALLLLPQPHLQMLRQLCSLLHSVAAEEATSLMDSRSLAVVMTPNIIPTHHSDPTLLQTALKTNTGIVQLLIDHAHLIGLAPPHVISHAHQLAEEDSTNEEAAAASSNDLLEGRLEEVKGEGKRDKQRRGSVTDRVLGWGSKLMSTIGGVSRDLGVGSRDQDHTHTPNCKHEDGLQLGNRDETTEQRLFDPSLPPRPHVARTPRDHKHRHSFIRKRRHSDSRRGNRHRSLFSNPFRGSSGSAFLRQESGRFSERRFPWLQGHAPSSPDPDVQLVGFGPTLTGAPGKQQIASKPPNDRGCPSNCHGLPLVPGNSDLPVSISEEGTRGGERKGGGGEREGGGGEREGGGGEREGGGGEREGGGRERETAVKVNKTYAVARRHSSKRMRCEVEGGGEGEEGRALKRRHTIYTLKSNENHTQSVGIRSSKSATMFCVDSDLTPVFKFSMPTPPHATQCTPVSVPKETDTAVCNVSSPFSSRHFTFSNPRQYSTRKPVVASSERNTSSDGGCVCGASPIPHLPEVTSPIPHLTEVTLKISHRATGQSPPFPSPRGPSNVPPGQLNEGFLLTPFPPPRSSPSPSPNLLEKISSELLERHLATPLTTPSLLANKVAGLAMNDSYHQAVGVHRRKPDNPDPLPLKFNASFEPYDDEGSKVVQEVSFSFKLNSDSSCHSNANKSPGFLRVPLSPVQRPRRTSAQLRPPKAPLQRKFALTPRLSQRSKFTDLSSSLTPSLGRAEKTPKMKKRAQMYVIPSSSNHGDKENSDDEDIHVREWIV